MKIDLEPENLTSDIMMSRDVTMTLSSTFTVKIADLSTFLASLICIFPERKFQNLRNEGSIISIGCFAKKLW